MRLLTKEQQESYQNSNIVKKNLKINMLKIKNIVKLETVLIIQENIGATHSIFNLKYSVPEKIPIAFHNGSNCDYPFIIKKLAEEYNKQFTYLGENTENI